jgi:predicted dehydrogenase
MDDSIDLVDICLPPHLHAEVAIAALDAGKHVICENRWPAACRGRRHSRRHGQRSPGTLFPVFQYRFGPASPRWTRWCARA